MREKVQVHICQAGPDGQPLFLVLRRTPKKDRIWQPVTGKAERDEKPPDTARREISEETGIRGLTELRAVSEFEYDKGDKSFHETVFVARTAGATVTLSDEHEEFRWVPYDEARRLIHFESNKTGLDAAYNHIRETQKP